MRVSVCGSVRRVVLYVFLIPLLAACGGGGGGGDQDPPPDGAPAITQFEADRTSYFIGERARLTARFSNGTGRIQPGNIPIQSGQTVESLRLAYGENQIELTVTNGNLSASRKITVPARYREQMRSIDAPFARAEHAAIRLNDGRVLIIGGEDAGAILPSSLWVFNSVTDTFEAFGAELSTGRVGFVAVWLKNGTVLVAGGTRSLAGAPTAEIIRPNGPSVVATKGALIHPRTASAATLLSDGRVLISGGTALVAHDTVEIYDPDTDSFTLLPGRLSVGRYGHTAVRINERRVFIYGGFTLTGLPAPPELYDPVSGSSTLLPAAEPNARGGHAMHTMQDGSVLIVGGEDANAIPLASVLRFNPASNAITPFANLATPRSSFGLGRLGDERILVAGGVKGQSQIDLADTTETLAPDATRRNGPDLARARWLHTVTPLVDGRLLIVGGLGPDRLPLRTAELYE